MKLMGIDYGTKRVGVAFSNDDGTMAFPHKVLKNDSELIENLSSLIEERKAERIVVGHSLDLKGSPNELNTAIEAFVGELTLHTGLPIHLEPEQFSTQAALRIQGRNAHTDASAAALILESYILKQHD